MSTHFAIKLLNFSADVCSKQQSVSNFSVGAERCHHRDLMVERLGSVFIRAGSSQTDWRTSDWADFPFFYYFVISSSWCAWYWCSTSETRQCWGCDCSGWLCPDAAASLNCNSWAKACLWLNRCNSCWTEQEFHRFKEKQLLAHYPLTCTVPRGQDTQHWQVIGGSSRAWSFTTQGSNKAVFQTAGSTCQFHLSEFRHSE